MKREISIRAATVFLAAAFPALGLSQAGSGAASATADALTLPAGSTLQVELTSTLNSKTNQNGDVFAGKVTEPIIAHGEEVVPEGSTVEGHLTFVRPAGRAKGVAEMHLTLDSLVTPDGTKYAISAGLEDAQGTNGKIKGDEGTIEGPGKNKKGGAVETGVGAGAGAGVGAIADGGTGALYGAAIGAVAAVVHTIAKKHPELVLPPGTEMTFVVSRATMAKKVVAGPSRQ